MLTWLRSRSLSGRTASGLYGSIVAQAREPAFYAAGGVPDTLEGRFGMIVVHMFLLLERLRREGDNGQILGRALLEAFATDMDDSMREIGIGDLSVPRRVKKAAAALHERAEAYGAAWSEPSDVALAGRLANDLGLGPRDADRLAAYMRTAAAELDRAPGRTLASGTIPFPKYDA